MGIPQIIMIVLMALNLFEALTKHNKCEIKKHNFWTCLFAILIECTIFYYGGFWK